MDLIGDAKVLSNCQFNFFFYFQYGKTEKKKKREMTPLSIVTMITLNLAFNDRQKIFESGKETFVDMK